MDQKSSEDYYAALLKKLHYKRSLFDRAFWIILLAASGYFAFYNIGGAVLGGLTGWGICSILSTLDYQEKVIWHAEFLRHLHSVADEYDAGKIKYNVEKAIDDEVKRWWHR